MKRTTAFLVLLSLPLSGALQAQENGGTERAKAYLVADAHLDTQWNWDIQTTISEYVRNTVNQNLYLLRHYPNYKFNFEGAVKYSWMKEYYPQQFEEVRKYAQQGRWHASGTSWDANDVLVPSAESVLRNIAYGQHFYRTELGTESTDIFLPDCFGFGWTLPTLAHHCGLIGFSSQKLGWRVHPFYEGNRRIPFQFGWWQGIDGSKIMMAHGYNYTQRYPDTDLSQNADLKNLAAQNPLNTVFHYYGTGDIGGSPTHASVRAVEKGLKGNGPVQIVSATSDQLFRDLAAQKSELPLFNGELLMDVHGTGCYTSQAAMKWYNRQNELLGDAAERAAVAAEWLNQASYPRLTLETSWKRFLFHQFHDDLTGTSIPRAYEFSWNDEFLSLKQFSDVLTSSVNSVSHLLNTDVKGIPVVLYNPLGYDVSDLVEITVDLPEAPRGISVYAPSGERVAAQYTGYADGKARLLVDASVPAAGFAVYDVRTHGNRPETVADTETRTLENSCYRLTLDDNGDIASLLDKRNGKELVAAGKTIRLALFTQNESFAWPAWEVLKKTVDQTPVSITGAVSIRLVENGSLRRSLCVEKRHGESVFRQYIRLYEGSRAERIDFYNEIDWRSTNALLKAEFPLTVANPKATYDLSLGSVERGNNTETAYEVYGHYWADLTDTGGQYGVAVLNNGKYGWDKPADNTLRLTLLHTPKTQGSFTYQNRQDFGHHTFTYSLLPHQGALNKAAVAARAEQLNQTVKAFQATRHEGLLGRSFSFVASDNPNVVIKAVKKAIDGEEYVIRVYETGGKQAQKALIRFAGEIEKAAEADGTEKELRPAEFVSNTLEVDINPYSVKTYKVRLHTSSNTDGRPVSRPLTLAYDRKCATPNEFRGDANFESGYSYAAELLPSTLESGRVVFHLADPAGPNGLSCKGDTLALPDDCNRLYLLAAAASTEDLTLSVAVDKGDTARLQLPSYTGFIGQWGHEGHTTGYLKAAQVAYAGTHRHSAEADCPYEFTYLYRLGIDLPEGCRYVILPRQPQAVIFAATATSEKQPAVRPAAPLFTTNNTTAAGGATPEQPKRDNLLHKAQLTACSGFVNENERPQAAVDGNPDTKWCATNTLPAYLDFDLGKARTLDGWKLVSAGRETSSYITSQCFLMGKAAAGDRWETIDRFDDNRHNIVQRALKGEKAYRYLRLLITRGTQNAASGHEARIYELEVYGK